MTDEPVYGLRLPRRQTLAAGIEQPGSCVEPSLSLVKMIDLESALIALSAGLRQSSPPQGLKHHAIPP
jgi:hypothetical protein